MSTIKKVQWNMFLLPLWPGFECLQCCSTHECSRPRRTVIFVLISSCHPSTPHDCTDRAFYISHKQLQSISLMRPFQWCSFFYAPRARRVNWSRPAVCERSCGWRESELLNELPNYLWSNALREEFDGFTWLQSAQHNSKHCAMVLINLQ